jgi:hypothetical protein
MSKEQTLSKWLPGAEAPRNVRKRSRASIYDFDGTLFRSPDRPEGEVLYLEKTGNLWPFSGWWGRIETLQPPLVPDPIPEEMWISETLAAYKADRAREDTNCYLMTGRPAKIRHRVKEILAVKELIFDEYYFRGMKGYPQHGDTFEIKIELIEREIVHSDLEVLEIWEDRPEHTSRFCMMAKRWKGRYGNHLKKVIVHDVLFQKHNEF